ncbi:hypothetical protein [Stenotrophomonas sp.]|uniref:hypothetical protein n=1 Tax=Stenotrophomonas sp. TaxID=69392 RepID=UPI0028AFB9CB|nr:hypothetical protein [Stenotrophomonas sp.]
MPLSPAPSAGALNVPDVIPSNPTAEVETTTQPAQPQTVENRCSTSKPAIADEVAAQKHMYNLAVSQGCHLVGAGESVPAVMQKLGIEPGTSAERLLYMHSGQKPPHTVQTRATATPHHVKPALPTPESDLLPFPVHIVRRDPHPGRDPGAEAWLTAKCKEIAGGANYQRFIDEIGDPTPDSDHDIDDGFPQVKSVNLDAKALYDQAMGSARHAMLGGKSLPAAAARFSITSESDLESLAMFAAREIGAPHVRDGECFIAVKKALGLGAYGEAVQVLVEAMP